MFDSIKPQDPATHWRNQQLKLATLASYPTLLERTAVDSKM
jgi:hypothetical protein